MEYSMELEIITIYESSNYPITQFCSENEPNFVYVIYNQLTKLFKIGITSDITTRFRQIENSSGMKINPIFILELEINYDEKANLIESYLHSYFKHKRTIGEWFNLSIKDLMLIKYLLWNINGCDFHDYSKKVLLKKEGV